MTLGCSYQGYEFGAGYLDSTCIDGYLWDAESCDEPGGRLRDGGDIPCPRCNTAEMLREAVEEAKSGSCGVAMLTPWCAAVAWEAAVGRAFEENAKTTSEFLSTCQPFDIEDWPDREAVYEGRAPWDRTITVHIDPSTLTPAGRSALNKEQG